MLHTTTGNFNDRYYFDNNSSADNASSETYSEVYRIKIS